MEIAIQLLLLKYGIVILAYAFMTAFAYRIGLFHSSRDLHFMIGMCGFMLFVQSLSR